MARWRGWKGEGVEDRVLPPILETASLALVTPSPFHPLTSLWDMPPMHAIHRAS